MTQQERLNEAARRVLTPEAAAAYIAGDDSATDAAGHEAIAREAVDMHREEILAGQREDSAA